MLGLVALYLGGAILASRGSSLGTSGVQSSDIGGGPNGLWTLALNVSLGLIGPRPSRANLSAALFYIFSIIDRFRVAPVSLALSLLQLRQ